MADTWSICPNFLRLESCLVDPYHNHFLCKKLLLNFIGKKTPGETIFQFLEFPRIFCSVRQASTTNSFLNSKKFMKLSEQLSVINCFGGTSSLKSVWSH